MSRSYLIVFSALAKGNDIPYCFSLAVYLCPKTSDSAVWQCTKSS